MQRSNTIAKRLSLSGFMVCILGIILTFLNLKLQIVKISSVRSEGFQMLIIYLALFGVVCLGIFLQARSDHASK